MPRHSIFAKIIAVPSDPPTGLFGFRGLGLLGTPGPRFPLAKVRQPINEDDWREGQTSGISRTVPAVSAVHERFRSRYDAALCSPIIRGQGGACVAMYSD